MAGRGWGPWSRIKLEALADYLSAFTVASKRATSTLYLDLFAGAPDNFDRGTGDVILGSGHRALAAKPEFDKVVLCELQPRSAARLREALQEVYPGRDLTVLVGDCNAEIPRYLRTLDYSWRRGAAVFAMVDQYAAEVKWSTLQLLSQWRQNKRGFKVELWLYFGDGLLPRGLHGEDEPDPEFAARVDAMFGTDYWRVIWQARHDKLIDGAELRNELINLMRWRLEHELGYGTTIPLQFTNTRGTPIYTVIFATSNDTGSEIMASVFEKHGVALARMRDVAKAQRALDKDTDDALFEVDAEQAAAISPSRGGRDPLLPPVTPYGYDQ